jgi:DNA polymerase III epsilon subunit-like protein
MSRARYVAPTEEKGKVTDDLEEKNNQNPKAFSKLHNKEKWVLVDLRTLRFRMRYDNSITLGTYKIIEKCDYVFVSPEILK